MLLSQKDRFVYCHACGCKLEINGVCQICGNVDNPLLPGMVPNVVGLTEIEATKLLKNHECQLALGDVTSANDETVPAGAIISSDPVADTQLKKKAKVNILVSLGPSV